jgi:phage-related protein
MSRSLSVASILEAGKVASNVPFVVCLDIEVINPATGLTVEFLYLVNNNEDIVFNGHTYLKFPFDIALKQESGTQPEITLTAHDYSNTIQQRMQQYAGGVGFNVTVMVVNTAALSAPPEVSEYFQVIAASSANYDVSFTLGAESALAKAFPRRRQMRDFCSWAYKDGNCKYAGSLESCDMTLNGANGCAVHTNVINFGGFPGITGGGRVA